MSEPMPTFASNRDRVTYLLAEYKIPLSVMALAASIWLVFFTPQLPTPPQTWLDFSLAWFLLALPAFIFCKVVVKRLHSPEFVNVGIADPGENLIYDGKKVPPEVWAEKTVVGSNPLAPDDGMFDYVVTRFNWYGDIGELEVRGCERADMDPAEALENATRVDEYYEHMHDVRRAYSRLKSTVLRKCTEIHDATIMTMMTEEEGAKLAPNVEITRLIQDLEKTTEELPDAPAPDGPPIHQRMYDVDGIDASELDAWIDERRETASNGDRLEVEP